MKKLKIYLCALAAIGIASCSGDDLDENSGTASENEDLISTNFISTIESWTNLPHTSVEWTHETNSDGELIKSSMYEKYPSRVLWELEYLAYNEDGLPTEYKKVYYNFGEPVNTLTWEVSYNESGTIDGITAYKDGSLSHGFSFSQLDDEKRVKSVLNLDDTEEFLNRDVFAYNENGNRKNITRYSTESGSDESDIVEKWDFSYTQFGDRKSTIYSNREKAYTSKYTYSYREDHTLKSRISITVSEENPDKENSSRMEFDEEEKIIYYRSISGKNRWEYFYSSGNLEVVEHYYQDNLLWAKTLFEDGSSEMKIVNTDDGSYKIEYRNPDDTVYKVEYYDADDNLLNTETYKTVQMSGKSIKNMLSPKEIPGQRKFRELEQAMLLVF